MREGRAGKFEGLAAVPHVDLAVQVGDLVRVGGDVHAAEGLAAYHRGSERRRPPGAAARSGVLGARAASARTQPGCACPCRAASGRSRWRRRSLHRERHLYAT